MVRNCEVSDKGRRRAKGSDNLRTILLIEDDDETRCLLRRSLRAQGYRVLEAEDETEAAEMAAGGRVDAVLTDLEMPSLGRVLALAREYGPLRGVPVAALDGDSDEGPRPDGLHVLNGTHSLRGSSPGSRRG